MFNWKNKKDNIVKTVSNVVESSKEHLITNQGLVKILNMVKDNPATCGFEIDNNLNSFWGNINGVSIVVYKAASFNYKESLEYLAYSTPEFFNKDSIEAKIFAEIVYKTLENYKLKNKLTKYEKTVEKILQDNPEIVEKLPQPASEIVKNIENNIENFAFVYKTTDEAEKIVYTLEVLDIEKDFYFVIDLEQHKNYGYNSSYLKVFNWLNNTQNEVFCKKVSELFFKELKIQQSLEYVKEQNEIKALYGVL